MQELGFATKQKSLAELQYRIKHYQEIYHGAKLKGKVVLRQYFRKANDRIQRLQFRSEGK